MSDKYTVPLALQMAVRGRVSSEEGSLGIFKVSAVLCCRPTSNLGMPRHSLSVCVFPLHRASAAANTAPTRSLSPPLSATLTSPKSRYLCLVSGLRLGSDCYGEGQGDGPSSTAARLLVSFLAGRIGSGGRDEELARRVVRVIVAGDSVTEARDHHRDHRCSPVQSLTATRPPSPSPSLPTTIVERSSRRPPAVAAQCAVWTCCWPSCWTAAPWTSCPEVGTHRTHRGGMCMYALIAPLCPVAQLRTRPASSSLSRSGCPHSPCSHDLTLLVYVWCPSQPLHSCLFPHSSRFSSFHRTTNPMSCKLDGILVVGHSGQVTLTLTSRP